MTRIRAHLVTLAAVLTTVPVAAAALHSPAEAAVPPGAPASCAATQVSGAGAGYQLGWTRPSADGGAPIWRYTVKVKGQASPVVQLSSASKTTENATRSYHWTGPVPAKSPVTFQIRAVNATGYSAWCEAVAADAAAPPQPTPTPTTPYPTATPTPTPSPSPSTTPSPGGPFLAYGESSFFQSELFGAPVDSTLTSQFRSFVATHPDQTADYPLISGVGSNPWGIVYDLSDCNDPVWKIGAVSGSSPAEWASLKSTGFHAPGDLGNRFTGTSDSPFVVIDRCTGISVWAAKAAKGTGNVINVSTYGAFRHDTNGLHKKNPLSNSTQNFRSRGVIPDSMLIRRDLMDHAKATGTDLGHVLEVFFVETDSAAGSVHPMIGAESGKYGFGAEGTRIAVNPNVNLVTRSCSAEALVIARTLQNYGGYLGDNSGSQTMIKAEQESAAHPVWAGALVADELAGCITWNDFVVIKPGWQ
jgi:hypothetical protein